MTQTHYPLRSRRRIWPVILALLLSRAAVYAQTYEKSPPFHIGKAVITFAPQPPWAFGARINRTTTGIFKIHVPPNGTVAEVDIVNSSGYQTIDLAWIDALYKWRFVPGSAETVEIPITFKVNLLK